MSDIYELVEKSLRGRWTKGSSSWKHGRTCLIGHFNQVNIDAQVRARHYNVEGFAVFLNMAVEELFPRRVDHSAGEQSYYRMEELSRFNDHHQTTEADVILTLRRADEIMRERDPELAR